MDARADACPRCAAPLRLRDEPAAAPVDQPIDLDRRQDPPGARRPYLTPRFWMAEPGPARSELPEELAVQEVPDAGASPFTTQPGQPAPPTPPARLPRVEPLPPPAVELRFQVPSPFRRVASWVVDGLLSASLATLLVLGGLRLAGASGAGVDALPVAAALGALLHFTHASLGHALAGRTLGKWMLDLEVVGPDGRPPGPGRSALRAALSLASAGALGLGLLLALVDGKGRALHDRFAGTSVVRSP